MIFSTRHALFKTALFVVIPAAIIAAWVVGYVHDWSNLPLLVSLTGVLLSITFLVQRQRLGEVELFKDLFVRFNQRYDEMNGGLNTILESEGKLGDSEKHVLYDYFNLCAEQYLFYQEGYIPRDVWQAWTSGMRAYYEDERIRELWCAELESPSYYGFPETELRS